MKEKKDSSSKDAGNIEDQRDSKRVHFDATVHLGNSPEAKDEDTSHIIDISRTGIGVRTSKTLKTGDTLQIYIDHDYDVYKAEGLVEWTINVSPFITWLIKNKAGIKFMQADQRIINLYESESGTGRVPGLNNNEIPVYEGPVIAERCRNKNCGQILFTRTPDNIKKGWAICSENPPQLESTGEELFYTCPHCKAKNRVYSDYLHRKTCIRGIITE